MRPGELQLPESMKKILNLPESFPDKIPITESIVEDFNDFVSNRKDCRKYSPCNDTLFLTVFLET